jgi:hypothetical protein
MQTGWLVKLYPRDWRERYEEEMLALLEQHPATALTGIDLLLGALDARLHSPHRPAKMFSMLHRQRKMTLAVFQAWVAYVLAGLIFYGTLDDNPLTQLARTTPELQWPVYVVQTGAALSLLAMLTGALPIGFGVLRSSLAARRSDVLYLMLGVPLLCLVSLCVYAAAMFIVNASGLWPGVVMFRIFEGLFVLGAILSTVAVSAAMVRAQPEASLLRFARWTAILMVSAMGLTLLGLVAWAASALAVAPQIFYATPGVAEAIDTAHSWLLSALIMTTATLAAIVMIVRGNGRTTANPS